MAKLYFNKDIVADKDKMMHWYLTGDGGISFSDIQGFIDWIDPSDNNIDIELHSCGGRCDETYAIYDALRATGKEISTRVVGKCASAATIVLLAAPLERRSMYEHVNYNILGEIVEINYVPFENCRLYEEDENGYVSKIAIHPDWSGKKTRSGKPLRVDKAHIDFIDVFNPRKDVVLAQIEAAGGIEYYKGQILWVSGAGRNIYPRSRADRVVTEMSTDEGLSNVKYRNVRCNFLPAGMMITKKGTSRVDENGKEIKDDEDDGFSETLVQLQGDTHDRGNFDYSLCRFVPNCK